MIFAIDHLTPNSENETQKLSFRRISSDQFRRLQINLFAAVSPTAAPAYQGFTRVAMESSEATAEATFAATLTPIRCNDATNRNRQLPPLSVRCPVPCRIGKNEPNIPRIGASGLDLWHQGPCESE